MINLSLSATPFGTSPCHTSQRAHCSSETSKEPSIRALHADGLRNDDDDDDFDDDDDDDFDDDSLDEFDDDLDDDLEDDFDDDDDF